MFDEPSRLGKLPAFPADAEPPLPPPRPWPQRLARLIWRLFPATIVCIPLFGALCFLAFGTMGMLYGCFMGLVIGVVIGFAIDLKRSLGGETIDD